ncbi:hypothetical protein JTE90_029559 [Oedothorax gibbosus]|uniref:Uncharacterized protein n=1 Tax=Oedothorax gibbosus TaxID=931172 RepID=A0AAV6VAX1_9ARAC|nr:hypothetical protein JTE90_029559 [Oedothorax gibbosus]
MIANIEVHGADKDEGGYCCFLLRNREVVLPGKNITAAGRKEETKNSGFVVDEGRKCYEVVKFNPLHRTA